MKRGSELDLITSDSCVVGKRVGIQLREKMGMISFTHLFNKIEYLSCLLYPRLCSNNKQTNHFNLISNTRTKAYMTDGSITKKKKVK